MASNTWTSLSSSERNRSQNESTCRIPQHLDKAVCGLILVGQKCQSKVVQCKVVGHFGQEALCAFLRTTPVIRLQAWLLYMTFWDTCCMALGGCQAPSLCPFGRWGNWVLRNFTNLPKVLQSVRDKAGISYWSVQSLHHYLQPCIFFLASKMREHEVSGVFIWEEFSSDNLIGSSIGQGDCEMEHGEWAVFVFLRMRYFAFLCLQPQVTPLVTWWEGT